MLCRFTSSHNPLNAFYIYIKTEKQDAFTNGKVVREFVHLEDVKELLTIPKGERKIQQLSNETSPQFLREIKVRYQLDIC